MTPFRFLAALAIAGTAALPGCGDIGMAPGTTSATAGLNGYFDCLERAGVTLVAAHRGGPIENSLHGMQEIVGAIPAVLEVDVAAARDGVLFLMHDDTLTRTTTGTGRVVDRDWAYIEDLHIRDAQGKPIADGPPTLREALDWAGGKAILELDIKPSAPVERIVETVKEAQAGHRIIYIAYTIEQAVEIHRLHPQAMISISLHDPGDLRRARAAGIPAGHMLGWTGTSDPDTEIFDALNAADIEVIFGTLGGAESIDNRIAASGTDDFYADLARDGVDIIATDAPIRAYEAMKKAGLPVNSPACEMPG